MSRCEVIDIGEARRQLLAQMLSGEARAAADIPEPIGRHDPAGVVPLTAEQRQLWLHAQMAPEMPLYNESITIHRLGPYDHRALELALTEIVRRHAIWRTAFVEIDGELVQKVAPPPAITLRLIDISHLPERDRDAEAVRLATEDARAPIALDTAPLFRARVVKLDQQEHRLYLTLHHIIFDGVSIYRVLVPELAALVAAFEVRPPTRLREPPLPEPALQYADYAVWQAQRSDPATRQIEHWREALVEPLPRLEIIGDRPRPALPTLAGSMEVFELDGPLIEALRGVAQARGATLYMVLLAAYKTMLFRYTGATDIIVGGVTDTRARPELQPLMGYFLNTMALRSQPAGDLPFSAYLSQVKRSVIGALGASDVPFDRVIRALDIKRGPGTHPLFNTLFSIEPPVDPFPPGWDLTQMDVVVGAAKYDLYLELDERPQGMAGRFLYSTELFDAATIRRMIAHWTRLLEGVAEDAATPLARLPMLDADEIRTLTRTWNHTARPLPRASVVEWFAAEARAHPEWIAVEQGETIWSYAELDRRSDVIAARLVKQGIAPGMLVGLALERSPWLVAAMLGVAKTGAAYLPLDPGFPPARLALIAEDAQPALVVVEPGSERPVPAGIAPLLRLDHHWSPEPFVAPRIDGEALVYVLYTSGSTGKPKGVEVSHAALVNLLTAMQAEPGFARGESLLAVTTLSFDIAALELWLPLVAGGRIILASRETASDMATLAELIAAAQPDVMQATPATWRGLIEAGWPGARSLRALCGGEALPRALVEQLLPRVGELWNMYGPTETTIWSTIHQVDAGAGPVAIGRPIANTLVRVLDPAGNDLPIGVPGELYIGGRGLARGYRGRPDLTAERFIDHGGMRLYRTGDLARWRADGVLECLGRIDNEEKIRGFRIAVEEVESTLARLPGVIATAVRAWPDASGERALTAYVVGEGDAAGWRTALAALLPDYMIPSRFITLDTLPLTPNGKVDRAALPEPGTSLDRVAAPPETPEEKRMAAIWQTVLQVDQVCREDDFFELGGHSLLVARLLHRIEGEYGERVPMAALFHAPKLADMAALLAPANASGSWATESAIIVPIQPRGSRTPILWLEGGATFRPLAERLGADQPFLGVAIDAILEAAGGCPARFEDAAALVAAAIREAQPQGPWRIGGWCTSGILAYAVAAHLHEAGEDAGENAPFVILIHAAHPVKFVAIGGPRLFLSKLWFHVGKSIQQPKGARWRYFRDRLQGMSDAVSVTSAREMALRAQLDQAARRYHPPRYDGDVLLFQPADHPDVLDFIDDWAEGVTGRFRAHVIPGGHRTMLEAPQVDALAALLREALAIGDAAARFRRPR